MFRFTRDRPPIERPVFARANNGTVDGRLSRSQIVGLTIDSRSKSGPSRPRSRLRWGGSPKKKGHHLFRCPFVVIFGRNHHSGRVCCQHALVYHG